MTGGNSGSGGQRALKALRQMIFDGDLPAGTDHLETELADRLGLSRTPVREALLALAAQGLIEIRPRRGVRVLPISPTDMREVYDILTALESMAAARVAAAGLKAEQLAPLDLALQDMDTAIEQGDLLAWADADDRFHAALVVLSGNARLDAIVGMMRDQVRRARRATLTLREPPHRSNEDHRAVLAAIRAGDADRARRLYHDHGSRAREDLLELLGKLHLRGI